MDYTANEVDDAIDDAIASVRAARDAARAHVTAVQKNTPANESARGKQ